MRIFIILFAFITSLSCFATGEPKLASSSKNPPKEEVKEIYIPKDLDDCFRELDKLLKKEDIEKIRKKEIEAIDMHFGLGMGLRNAWGLWGGSRLAEYFNKMGIFHPDDMSGIILDSYVRYLRKEPIRLEDQIAVYKKFWEDAKKAQDGQKSTEEKKDSPALKEQQN